MEKLTWSNPQEFNSISYKCGYCGESLASQKGYTGYSISGSVNHPVFICICHVCTRPTFFDFNKNQTPGAIFGNKVNDIPDTSVSELYDEARRATGASCYTSAVLSCRKLLMHIAVSKGANPGETFVKYVNYLVDNHYVPPDAKDWVDHIRKKGNEATHEIVIMKQEDAQELLSFIEMILKVIYEFPALIKRKNSPPST